MEEEARKRMVSGIVAEKKANQVYELRREAEQLYHWHAIGQVSDEEYIEKGKEIKEQCETLGVRLIAYYRGIDCVSLMNVDKCANE